MGCIFVTDSMSIFIQISNLHKMQVQCNKCITVVQGHQSH